MAGEEPGGPAELEAESPEGSAKPTGKKGLPLPALIGIVIGVQALLSFIILSTKVAPQLRSVQAAGGDAHATEHEKQHEEPGQIISLEPMVMNLATLEGEKPSFAKIGLAVEFAASKKGGGHGGGGGMSGRLPLVRDAVITTVSSRTMADVTNPQGKERLRRELLEQITTALGGESVRNVYFTNFVIQ